MLSIKPHISIIYLSILLGKENLTHPHCFSVKFERHSASQFDCVYIRKKRNWRSELKKHCRSFGLYRRKLLEVVIMVGLIAMSNSSESGTRML